MGTLIKEQRIVTDSWRSLERGPQGGLPEVPTQGDVVVPLALWLARGMAGWMRQWTQLLTPASGSAMPPPPNPGPGRWSEPLTVLLAQMTWPHLEPRMTL